MERSIRENKREIAALEGAIKGSKDKTLAQDLKLDWNRQKDKLKEKQNILVDFIAQTELRRDNTREMIGNWTLKDRNKEIKRINNKVDLAQYNKYKDILQKDIPTFDKFQEMKYNKTNEYSILKSMYREERLYEKIVNESLELNIKGAVEKKIEQINIENYKFKTDHINYERGHNVSKEEAQKYINESKVVYVRWNGKVKIYVSKDGCTVVNVEKKEVSTAYKYDEYDDKFKRIMEVIENDKVSNN